MRERLILIGGIVLLNLVLMALAHLLEWNKALGELVAMGPVASLTTIDPWWAAMIAALSYSFLRTAGSEELLFRGLLYKRLIPLIGQKKANLIQALLFTLLHNWIIHRALPDAPLWVHADLFIRIFILSWVVGWYMEVRDNGSLLMPWICHGIANTLTFLGLYLA
jgi:membrane protease YdiL (CAAX protease family)